MKLEIDVPPELVTLGIAPDLKRFFDAMIYKLRENAHKGRWEGVDLAKTLDHIKAEVDELKEAISEGNVISIVLEGADIANFALIAATIALDGKKEPRVTVVQDEGFKDITRYIGDVP